MGKVSSQSPEGDFERGRAETDQKDPSGHGDYSSSVTMLLKKLFNDEKNLLFFFSFFSSGSSSTSGCGTGCSTSGCCGSGCTAAGVGCCGVGSAGVSSSTKSSGSSFPRGRTPALQLTSALRITESTTLYIAFSLKRDSCERTLSAEGKRSKCMFQLGKYWAKAALRWGNCAAPPVMYSPLTSVLYIRSVL